MDKDKSTIDHQDETSWKESPFLIIKGFLMGSADVVPGVSGGTMALITGIYDRLIYAIQSVNKEFVTSAFRFRLKKALEIFHWKFLLLLFTGIICAVLFFTKVVPLQVYMFTHPEVVYGLFFGLIVGSIFLIVMEVAPDKRGWKNILPLAAGTLVGFWIVTLVPTQTPETFWFVFASGALAICAMILPGISGSYILLVLRQYDYILTQISNLGTAETVDAVLNLAPFFIGAAVGLMLFSRVLSWLLNNFHAGTLLVLIGFLIGSLYVIWPYQDREYQEIVRSTRIAEYTDPDVRELMQQDEPNLPSYERIGRVLNPNAPAAERKVEIETVSQKIFRSEPFIPDGSEEDSVIWNGIIGIGIGLMLIWFISYLRKT